ncbi:unnamed protein product, partial [Heterosigma akashiwo]
THTHVKTWSTGKQTAPQESKLHLHSADPYCSHPAILHTTPCTLYSDPSSRICMRPSLFKGGDNTLRRALGLVFYRALTSQVAPLLFDLTCESDSCSNSLAGFTLGAPPFKKEQHARDIWGAASGDPAPRPPGPDLDLLLLLHLASAGARVPRPP